MELNTSLSLSIEKFLNENYVFRKLQIHEYFDSKTSPIIWMHKHYVRDIIAAENCQETCELLEQGFYSDWFHFNKKQLDMFIDEFRFQNLRLTLKIKKTEIKTIVEHLITNSSLTKTILFNPLLKELIQEGRHEVTKVRPLSCISSERIEINAKIGQKYYLCRDTKSPFIADPCYIISLIQDGTYNVMFFTNVQDNWSSSKKTEINGWGFTSVYANEIGLTPAQAVRNNKN